MICRVDDRCLQTLLMTFWVLSDWLTLFHKMLTVYDYSKLKKLSFATTLRETPVTVVEDLLKTSEIFVKIRLL